ncbi:MAG: hypothetical protein JJV97_02830 [SAR324 cluster bacterium]|nr:hypothetical protein [SAR324 cluster bacterium]
MLSFKLSKFFADYKFTPSDLSLNKDELVVDVLQNLPQQTNKLFVELSEKNLSGSSLLDDVFVDAEGGIYCKKSIKLVKPYVSARYRIYIAAGVLVEPCAFIKGNSVILSEAKIRHSCYIRGNSIIGPGAVVGHCSEIKSSILFPYSSVGHFNYVGDSLVGSYVNLGAGAKLANLEFRCLGDKKKNFLPKIKFNTGKENLASDLSKCGSIIGDGSEIGCNAVLAPGCFLGKNCVVWPTVFLKKGVYPPKFKAKLV